MDALCQRWHVAPSLLLAEDAGLVIGMLNVIGQSEAVPTMPTEDEQRLMTLMGATTVGE